MKAKMEVGDRDKLKKKNVMLDNPEIEAQPAINKNMNKLQTSLQIHQTTQNFIQIEPSPKKNASVQC